MKNLETKKITQQMILKRNNSSIKNKGYFLFGKIPLFVIKSVCTSNDAEIQPKEDEE